MHGLHKTSEGSCVVQTEVQILSLQSDDETGERIKTAIALSGSPAVRSLRCRIEQGVEDIRGRFLSFYLCQVAIESVKRVPGLVRVTNHSEVVYALISPRESVEGDCEAKSGLRSNVVPPVAEGASAFCSRIIALRSHDESARYAGVVIHG
jgi:hypothetical protein